MKPQILVVDDSMTVRMDLRGALTAAGFEVVLCGSKRDAETLLQQRAFAAIVLDVMLPDGDGTDILRLIRSNTDLTNMVVVMLSTEAEVRDRVRGLSMGADEYVGKPYDIAYFIRCLRGLCRRNRQSAPPPAPVVAGRRILAVDDSPTFLGCLARALREDGHDVVLARSGREALDMLAAQTIDCIVLDLQMPELDGLEVLRRIRQTPGREATPTMMLTASEDPRDQSSATAAGVDEYMLKASTFEIVRAKIRGLLRKKHAERSSNEQAPARSFALRSRQDPRSIRRDDPPSSRDLPRHRHVQPTTPSASSSYDNHFSTVFLEVASTMGMTADLPRQSFARSLRSLGIDPRAMTLADLPQALPMIRDTLQMFCSPEDAHHRGQILAAIAARSARSSVA